MRRRFVILCDAVLVSGMALMGQQPGRVLPGDNTSDSDRNTRHDGLWASVPIRRKHARTLRGSSLDHLRARFDKMVLEDLGRPLTGRVVSDQHQRDETLVLDADLTGRPVSSTSQTFLGAAFGYMDGEIRLGYQLAEICLLDLIQEAEHRLG